MIWTLLNISLRRLLHNRVELLLMFAVPIAFFSIFAVIFGGGVGGVATPKVKVVAVDEAASLQSKSAIDSLHEGGGLRFMRDQPATEVSREDARQMVRNGDATMAIVLSEDDGRLTATLLADSSDQVAGQVVSALVTRSLMVAAAQSQAMPRLDDAGPNAAGQNTGRPNGASPSNLGPSNLGASNLGPSNLGAENMGVGTQVQQASATAPQDPPVPATAVQPITGPGNFSAPSVSVVPSDVKIVDVMGTGKSNPVVSMYAAGIAVMFLLFGASGGGGALLDERESRTLDRLLSTQMTMDQLLLGKWFYLTLVGIVQVSVMFAWGQLVFGVDLIGNLDGFIVMTTVTAAAAAAFGLFLATLCKTRGQLNGLSVILILTMSALGGSMVPRYVMSEKMRLAGMWTFNAWALDGYDKVFWRDLPVGELAPQVYVLMAAGIAFLALARLLAVRWECD